MRVELLSYVAARVPHAAVGPAARLLGAVLAWSRPRQVRAWRENVRALGAPLKDVPLTPLGAPLTAVPSAASAERARTHAAAPAVAASNPESVFTHHLLAHYEAFAMLGGRRFSVDVEGEEHLRSALRRGKGLLVATAHVGGWNVGAGWLHATTGLHVHTVAGTQIGRSWTSAMRRAYGRRGIWIHDREGSTPRLVRALREGEIVVLHVDGDQHAAPGLALRGLQVLAKRSLAPILPGVVERCPGGVSRIRLFPPLSMRSGAGSPSLPEMVLQLLGSARPEQWTLFRPLAGGVR
jgi:hypothetical protein